MLKRLCKCVHLEDQHNKYCQCKTSIMLQEEITFASIRRNYNLSVTFIGVNTDRIMDNRMRHTEFLNTIKVMF